jgi:two-component system chemotaxis response regulator CheY
VKEAVGGEEALEMLDQCDPDLLITDLRTPSMSGIDLIRRIRGEEKWMNLPIIAISAYSHDQLAHAALQGATRVLRKPFEPNRLLSAVFELTRTAGIIRNNDAVQYWEREPLVYPQVLCASGTKWRLLICG